MRAGLTSVLTPANALTLAETLTRYDDTQLRAKKAATEEELRTIRAQIEAADTNRIRHGEFADANWYKQAHNRRTFLARYVQLLQAECGRRTQEQKRLNTLASKSQAGDMLRAFRAVIIEYHPEEFDAYWEIARLRVEQGE
mgnify:CR=1 FL=1